MHEVLVNLLGGLSLPRKSVVRLTDSHDMTLDVYRGRKTTIQQQQSLQTYHGISIECNVKIFICWGIGQAESSKRTQMANVLQMNPGISISVIICLPVAQAESDKRKKKYGPRLSYTVTKLQWTAKAY